MGKYRRSSHSFYYCVYHIVWTPKYRYCILREVIADMVEDKIRTVCSWKEVEVLELNVQPDHVHLMCSIPPKCSVAEVLGTIKGKTAINMFKAFPSLKKKPYWGNHFWSRGYFVSTIGLDEDKIRRYIKYQEDQDKQEEADGRQTDLFN
ncbi:IS200/IS605 family transposase [Spirosoma sp. HMF4905]|uniref:IS200/IS605 family transposase n=1 Tax=Spirosoma arboris TaxID=2682092 RepID=A0A7K1SIH0_9BACT|nr:IS200/IS605 family transposase [Spirosoma arboris]MVM33621.1 IS200/IS605 family transposase [Spirosoma arboris]